MSRWSVMLFAALSLGTANAVPLNLTLKLTDGAQPFLGSVKTSGGQTVTLDSWNLYVSGVALIRADGSEVAVPGLNLVRIGAGQDFSAVPLFGGDVPAGDYRGIRFNVGVPRELNHLDATSAQSPLSVDDGMFWAWNSGYVFSRFEGKTTLNGTATPVAFHFGEDRNLLPISFVDLQKPSVILSVKAETGLTTSLNLDVARLVSAGVNGAAFDVSQKTYQQIHFGPAADQLRANLSGAFSRSAPPSGETGSP